MYKIIIEQDASYAGFFDTYTFEPNVKSVSITHESKGLLNFKEEPQTRELSLKESQSISGAFENFNFNKILEESYLRIGHNGWYLRCYVSKGVTTVCISLWSPVEDPSKPETTKLIKACNKIIDLFPKEKEDADS